MRKKNLATRSFHGGGPLCWAATVDEHIIDIKSSSLVNVQHTEDFFLLEHTMVVFTGDLLSVSPYSLTLCVSL